MKRLTRSEIKAELEKPNGSAEIGEDFMNILSPVPAGSTVQVKVVMG